MFSPSSFVLFLCLVILAASSNGKPLNSSIKPTDKPKAGQSFVVNNNCGLAKGESEMLAHIKAKVDYIAAQSSKGNTSEAAPVCSDGWVVHGDSCFLVIDIPAKEWNDARRNCLKLGGDLAKITSAAENQFISDLITKQEKTGRGAWIGLHRKPDKKFYWVDGTPDLTGYKGWKYGEPNNANKGDEDCVNMIGTGSAKGKWNDIPCTLPFSGQNAGPVVVCKKNSN
ncbi:perlucin-like protein [Oculina patagonica]